MTRSSSLSLLALMFVPLAASASGIRQPSHSQLTYSFTCPSGSSGHVSYTKNFVAEATSRFEIWVNGKYVHEVPHVAAALKVRSIEKVHASCGADSTLLFVETCDTSRDEHKQLERV